MLNPINTDIGENYVKKRTRTKQDIHYLNVDLEIWSKNDLQELVDAFGENVLVMFHERFDNGNILASFEISIDLLKDWENSDADEVIMAFCRLIENLPEKARVLWDGCYKKEFDIGFDSGNTEKRFKTEIKTETLKKAVDLDASIVITIYPILNYTLQEKDSKNVS